MKIRIRAKARRDLDDIGKADRDAGRSAHAGQRIHRRSCGLSVLAIGYRGVARIEDERIVIVALRGVAAGA